MSDTMTISTTSIYHIEDLADISGLSIEDIQDLVEHYVIKPENSDVAHCFFQEHCVHVVKQARRLRDDFELDRNGVSVAMTLLNRIEALENQIRIMEAHLGETKMTNISI